jgi:hypothetical protein
MRKRENRTGELHTRMKKLFISQPMNGRTDEEIIEERKNAIISVQEILNEDVEVIDSFFSTDASPVWLLGESLKLLSMADIVYFCDGWENYRGCRIEHTCAVEYGIDIIG